MAVSSLQMHIGFSENRNNNRNNNNNNIDYNSNDVSLIRDHTNDDMISKINTSINNNVNNSKNSSVGNNTGHTAQQTKHTANTSRLSSYYDGLLLRFQAVQEKHVNFKLTSLSKKKYAPSNFGTVSKKEDSADLGPAGGITSTEDA
jgi:hypothetical protein